MINIGHYLRRLKRIRTRMRKVLFINQRNLSYIYPNNQRIDYPIADNKLKTKELLKTINIPIAETYLIYEYFYELLQLKTDLQQYTDFVIKPAGGKGGGGILVINGQCGAEWLGINGKRYSVENIRKHISDIIFGVYSFGISDYAIVEHRILQHSVIELLSPFGLADVRVIVDQHRPIMAMLRLATKNSNGTANLHQGAVGVGIDINTGKTINATLKGEYITLHPDSNIALIGHTIPYWTEVLHYCEQTSEATPLKYLGIDVAISISGPVILEMNVRPGIEIQNANNLGMRALLESKAAQGQ